MKKNILLLAAVGFLAASCLGGGGPVGVLKTYDGGGAWLSINHIKNSSTQSVANYQVTEMAFNPDNHEELYFTSVDGGLWKSSDTGQNWQQILSKIAAYDFFVNPIDPNNILVSGIYNQHGKIVRTRDGGATWEEVYNEASIDTPVQSITANYANPRELYAGLSSGVAMKSVDGGTNWFVVKEFNDQLLKLRYDRYNNGLYALLRTKGLAKSSDSGINWQQLSSGSRFQSQDIFSVSDYQFVKMALDDSQAGVIYITSNKGLYKSLDDGKSWVFLNIPVKSTAEQPRAVASAKGGMLAYTSIGNTIFKTLDGGRSWQTQTLPTTEMVNKIIIDPILPQVGYAGLINNP